MPDRKRVAILTNFSSLERAFSLVSVAITQCIQLHRGGHEPHLFVNTTANISEDDCEVLHKLAPSTVIEKLVPVFTMHDYLNPEEEAYEGFGENVEKIEQFLDKEIVDGNFRVVICHDLLTLSWYSEYNQAIRNVADKNPNIQWFSWTHSCGKPRPAKVVYPSILRYTPAPNTTYVFLNKDDRARLAQQVGVAEREVVVIPNSKYPQEFFDFDPVSIEIVDKANLLDCDILLTLQTRIHPTKQLGHIVKLGGALRAKGIRAKVLIINSYSNSDDAKTEMGVLKDYAQKSGLGTNNLTIATDIIETIHFSPKVVRDLLRITDITFLPSREEAHSLALIEASLCKNLLILNDDFPPVKTLYTGGALYAKCSSEIYTTKYGANNTFEEEMGYWGDIAVRVIGELYNNTIWINYHNQKVNNNPDRVFRMYMDPLLHKYL